MKVRYFRHSTVAMLFLMLTWAAFLIPAASAQFSLNKKTNVTFSDPVQIPGRILPAGSYSFEMLTSDNTSVVLIRDKDGTAVANVLTINDYRMSPTDKTLITYSERAANAPPALRAWFYPDEHFGREFVYPRKEATMIAEANHESVPSIPDQTADNDLKSAQVTNVGPDSDSAQLSQSSAPPENHTYAATTTEPPRTTTADAGTPAPALVAENQPLPKTASPIYSIASFGLLALGMAGLLGIVRRRIVDTERLRR